MRLLKKNVKNNSPRGFTNHLMSVVEAFEMNFVSTNLEKQTIRRSFVS